MGLFLWWKINLHKKNGLAPWKEWTSLCILSRETNIIYYFLSFMQRTAKPLLAFVQHRPFFNQSHPYFWPSAAEWLPLFFHIAPCPTYCLQCLKQAMPKLAALSTGSKVFSTTIATGFLCALYKQASLVSAEAFPLWQQLCTYLCKCRQWCWGDILNIKHI